MEKFILLGSDPELFIKNKIEIISAEGYIEGTKEEPFEMAKGFGLQLDNVACEFNIPPSKSFEDFNNSIKFALDYVRDKLARENLTMCSKVSSHYFNPKYLGTENAKQFGCSPDYDVYRETVNEPPNAVENFTTVARHIHIGYEDVTKVTIEQSEQIMKAFDLFVTLPSVLTDPDKERRALYGKAGCFRPKSYGLEARTLSNFWIFDEASRKMIYEATIFATNLALTRDLSKVFSDNEEQIIKAINNYDEDIAKKLINEVITPFYEEVEEMSFQKTQ